MEDDKLALLLDDNRRSVFPGCEPRMCSISADHTLRQWNVKTGEEQRMFWRHKAAVLCLSVDWETGMAVTGSGDQSLALWDIEAEGEPLEAMFEGHGDWVMSVDVDWDNRRMISGAADGELRLWSLDEDFEPVSMREHRDAVCAVAAEWDSQVAISAGYDQVVRLWDLETQKCTCRIEGHTAPIWCASIDPEGGKKAVTGSSDRHLMVWDFRSKSCVRAMLQHNRHVVDLKVDWPTFQGMSCSADRSVILWDLQVAEPLQKFRGHPGSVWCMDVDWSGRRMVTGSGPGDNSIMVWDFKDGFVESVITGHEGSVWAVAVDWDCAHKALEASKGIGLQPKQQGEEDGSPSPRAPSHTSHASHATGQPDSQTGEAEGRRARKRWVKRRRR